MDNGSLPHGSRRISSSSWPFHPGAVVGCDEVPTVPLPDQYLPVGLLLVTLVHGVGVEIGWVSCYSCSVS